eukprot:jgi/Botrbrau1/20952/Bobra.0135s0071.1
MHSRIRERSTSTRKAAGIRQGKPIGCFFYWSAFLKQTYCEYLQAGSCDGLLVYSSH